jgi:hypothetical protein
VIQFEPLPRDAMAVRNAELEAEIRRQILASFAIPAHLLQRSRGMEDKAMAHTVRVEVEMHAFGKHYTPDGSVPTRIVELPAGEPITLDSVFKYGQNDFQPRELPSVSVGDIIRLNGKRFVVMPMGFTEVDANFQPPADDRGGFYAYNLGR